MVKGPGPLQHINVMRHLIVPNREVEEALDLLRDHGWLASGMRLFPSEDGEHRLVPVDPSAPFDLPPPLNEHETTQCEGFTDDRADSDWWNHLARLVGEDEVKAGGESWPSSHEFIADVMVVRIEDEVAAHRSAIAEAKLRSHPHIRLILSDEGVHGDFRIRHLSPIGARVGDRILTNDIPSELCQTKVTVRESGRSIVCDPSKAYFSTKLQSERLETLALAKKLCLLLERPLRVCDPFCGVGPALAPLLSETELVSDVLASDLNPDAVEMLLENLQRWDRRKYPSEATTLARIFDDRVVGIADATSICNESEFSGNWDLLIVNLPLRTIEVLPSLIPLLDRTSPSMVRGRVIVAESEIENANLAIREALPPLLDGTPEPSIRIKRDYNASLRLCSFEAWIAPYES
tara:strand:+ start:2639 stop:3856 length:1218 start_codon:yes stop_codon:yes gene_type:complete